LAAHAAVTPGGSPAAAPIPVAPVVAWVILVSTVLIQSVGVDDGAPAVLFAVTAIVPVVVITPQPPVSVTVYVSAAPATVGVPLIVTTFAAQVPVTPVGKLVTVAPVAPVVEYVILVIGVLIHTVCAVVAGAEVLVTVLLAVTAIVPVVVITPQPPVSVTVYVSAAPATVGVPLIVTTFAAQVPVTPVGKLVTVAPVAPVVEYVILVIGVLIHTVCAVVAGAEVSVTVLAGVTVIVPVAFTAPQPPVSGMV
jgi:hypothetical protein